MNERMRRLLTRRRLVQALLKIFRFVFILSICYIIISPLLNKISMSFMTPTDLYDRTVKTIPKHFTLANYADAVKYLDYFRSIGTTTLLCTMTGLLQALSCAVVGYGFARFRFRGNKVLFVLVVIFMVVPTQILLTPQYLNFKSFGLINGLTPFVLLGMTATAPRCGLYIFLARQYYRGIPREIDEAAAIDGAGPLQVFTRIMLRSGLPTMVTIFLFSFVWQWAENSYTPLFAGSYPTLARTLQSLGYDVQTKVGGGGYSFVSPADFEAYQSIIFAASTLLVILPLLLVYVLCQRFFVQSIEQTGIVG
ncbi:MAG TPA: carbohydrate ABC transporter permease [Firmicutes bacterium]|nr:carbohydrate ABC transporter permease [Bacillota bacterium]